MKIQKVEANERGFKKGETSFRVEESPSMNRARSKVWTVAQLNDHIEQLQKLRQAHIERFTAKIEKLQALKAELVKLEGESNA